MSTLALHFGITFGALVAEAAAHLGFAVDADGIPTDAADLKIAKDRVSDAWQHVLRADGVHSWTRLRQTITLELTADGDGPDNIDNDASVYRMPWFFTGRHFGEFRYDGIEQHGVITIVPLRDIQRRKAETSDTTGRPQWAAFRVDTNRQRTAVEVWPPPDEDSTVTLDVRAYPGQWDLKDRHFLGIEHDDLLKQAVRALSELKHENQRGACWATYMETLAAAIRLDKRTMPRNIGHMRPTDPAIDAAPDRRLRFTKVGSVDGVSVL